MRIKRGTLAAEKEGGRLYVALDAEPTSEPTDRTSELIDELRDRVRSLEDQLGQERDANRENRRIIAALTQRIPAIEAPAETLGESTEATEQPGRVEPQVSVEGTQRATERPDSEVPGQEQQVPWWRRVFGG
jgi:hypothetical protein